MRRLSVLIALLMSCTGVVGLATTAEASFVDRDCSDFDNQAQAQQYLLPGDPHRLDGDNDGIACDSLPCPCSSALPPQQPTTTATIRQWARVLKVVDGDTIDVRIAGRKHRVRLLGIDTPERNRCYGTAATNVTKRWLPVNTRVHLQSDPTQATKDRYGRHLRYVTKGTVDVNRQFVLLGTAKVYVYNNKPFQRTAAYQAAQRQAQAYKRGLWKACR